MPAQKEPGTLSRKQFLKISGLTGTAFCLGFYFPASAKEAKMVTASPEIKEIEMNAWIRIDTAGKVTIMNHRAEMGQGSYQAVPQIVAEELEVNMDQVNIEFASGDNKRYGSQITGGSSTVRGSYKNLLTLSATAREMLIAAAASKWNVAKNECYAEGGNIIHKPTGKKLHYGEVVEEASKLEVPKDVKLKERRDYKLIGKPLRRQDTKLKTNGTAIFGLDKKLPGMLYASVERNPRFRGVVKSYDDSAALKIPGVKKVMKVNMEVFKSPREGVAVIADSLWAAMQGRKALKVEWDDSGFEHINTADIYKRHEEILKTKEGIEFSKAGNPAAIIDKAPKKLDVVYQTPYQAHYCMEPLNCVAWYQKDKLEVWGPIQAPDWVQDYLSEKLKIPRENVIINMTFLGGGFGRKAFLDYPHEATMISKELGAPVQVVWTREDDATQGPFRPGISYRCRGAVDSDGIKAIQFKMAGQNIGHMDSDDRTKPNDSASEGFLKQYTDTIKNVSFHDVPFETPVPIMWWRSVYASTNGFAFESFIDELAVASGKDPLEFRRKHLQDERCQKLIDKLEEVSGWKNRKKNEGYGVAITECFSSTVGEIVKVSKGANGKIKVDHVWAVMDCGWYVNPDTIKAQVEGSVIMALGAATMHEVTFKDGLADQKNFYEYELPRINDIPPIDVYVMDNAADAGGVGEPGLPPLAPALANAVYDLTGKRIRKLPFSLGGV
jgi:isoquinoline 1-oxidoreductase subunit beta